MPQGAASGQLLTAEPGSMLVIEEIESALHPQRLHLLVELLDGTTSERGLQVIATTRSPLVLPAPLPLVEILRGGYIEFEAPMSTKLERPRVPHAEATKKAAEKLRAMNREEARQTFVKTGILTHDGKLTERYGGKKRPAATPTES